MGNRFLDRFRQAEADLRHARNAMKDEDFEWSCFCFATGGGKGPESPISEAWNGSLRTYVDGTDRKPA
jgi:hypothetical protein